MISIEFMGMPKAGKSTQLELVETVLKHERKCSIRSIYEGARVCPIDKKDRFQHNTWSFHNTMNRVMEAKFGNFDYLLIDRGVYDHIAFTHALFMSGELSREQYEAQQNYFKEFAFLEDIVLIFMIDPQESMKREAKHHQFYGRVMNDNFLSMLYRAYQELTPAMRYTKVDGSKSLEKNSEEILDFLNP